LACCDTSFGPRFAISFAFVGFVVFVAVLPGHTLLSGCRAPPRPFAIRFAPR